MLHVENYIELFAALVIFPLPLFLFTVDGALQLISSLFSSNTETLFTLKHTEIKHFFSFYFLYINNFYSLNFLLYNSFIIQSLKALF